MCPRMLCLDEVRAILTRFGLQHIQEKSTIALFREAIALLCPRTPGENVPKHAYGAQLAQTPACALYT